PFGCEVGSQFHQGHVYRGPPIIPDSRFSQVRFETLACLPWVFPARRSLSAGSHTPLHLDFRGLPTASLHLMRRLMAGSVPGRRAADGTAKCPESLCPMSK